MYIYGYSSCITLITFAKETTVKANLFLDPKEKNKEVKSSLTKLILKFYIYFLLSSA